MLVLSFLLGAADSKVFGLLSSMEIDRTADALCVCVCVCVYSESDRIYVKKGIFRIYEALVIL